MEARKLRLKISTASIAAIAVVSMSVPALASANSVDDLLNGLGLGGLSGQNGGPATGGSAPSGSTKAGTPPTYVPPLHGTNPHGEGDAATVQLTPGTTNPVSGTPGLPETIVVGSSKGEQNPDGTYHGHINIASLFGNELLSVNTTPGQTAAGPLDPLNTQLLGQICTQSTAAGFPICLTVLDAHSSTNGTGSTNNFSVATAQLGQGATSLVNANAVTSNGNISQDSKCQTASGQSGVANAALLANAITAGVSNASSSSTACNDGTAPSTTQSSSVINLQGAGVAIPAQGCENGTPNTNFTPLNPLLLTVCNANDTTSGQTTSPYGVREALTAFVLALPGGSALVKATTAGPESHAVAPAATVTPPCVGANCPGSGNQGGKNNGNGNGNGTGNGNGNGGPGSGSTSSNAGNGNGTLAFTGADLPWLAMLGLGLLGAGLAFAAMPGVRRPRLEA
ncbi:MAG: hypothetical protein QOD60_1516 [Solirubrobacterales bacterium]|jgi:hypothetical protein|nr:hypothetical protein [Solirubrobacterales bacterium]